MKRSADSDPRERLISALRQVLARTSYQALTVEEIRRQAHISRNTFYEQFADKQECFLAAHGPLSQRLVLEVAAGASHADPGDAAQCAIVALARFAEREPTAFTLLTHEAMLAGAQGWQARDQLMASLERVIETAWEQTSEEIAAPDMPAKMILGATIRLLGVHIRRGSTNHTRLVAGLIEWLDVYRAPREVRTWTELSCCAALYETEPEIPVAPAPPQRLPRGRHRQPTRVSKALQRGRILHAAAEVVHKKGAVETSVAEIASAAGISREAFYTHFQDKHDAFLAAQALNFEQLLAACAGAFFSSSLDWPERVWESGLRFTRFITAAPSMCYLAMAQSYALGPRSAKRADDSLWGFTVFLDEGYRSSAQAGALPRVVSEAIYAAAMEIIVSHMHYGQIDQMPGLLPLATYTILAPFIGREEANRFVHKRIAELKARNWTGTERLAPKTAELGAPAHTLRPHTATEDPAGLNHPAPGPLPPPPAKP